MANFNEFQSKLDDDNFVTIEDGETASDVLYIGGSMVAFYVPAAFDGASFTFKASRTPAGTLHTVLTDNAAEETTKTINASAGDYVIVNPADFSGMNYIQFIANTAQSGADAVIYVALRPL